MAGHNGKLGLVERAKRAQAKRTQAEAHFAEQLSGVQNASDNPIAAGCECEISGFFFRAEGGGFVSVVRELGIEDPPGPEARLEVSREMGQPPFESSESGDAFGG